MDLQSGFRMMLQKRWETHTKINDRYGKNVRR